MVLDEKNFFVFLIIILITILFINTTNAFSESNNICMHRYRKNIVLKETAFHFGIVNEECENCGYIANVIKWQTKCNVGKLVLKPSYTCTKKTITIKWNDILGATKYQIQIRENGKWKKVANVKKCSYKISKLSKNKKYKIRIRAIENYSKPYIGKFSNEILKSGASINKKSKYYFLKYAYINAKTKK